MEAKDWLSRLPPPDPAGEARVWRRFQETRAISRRPQLWWAFALLPAAALTAAALATFPLGGEGKQRSLVLMPGGDMTAWSEQVHIDAQGQGTAHGSDRDVRIDWEAGTVTVDVVPNSGTSVSIRTEEATIEVVGTVFSVRRDAFGATTKVARGKVAVQCDDGWRGSLTADSEHTCLPTRPAALLGRADALLDVGADAASVLETLDLGLARVDAGSAVEGELLARRIQVRADAGNVDGALQDAVRYVADGQRARSAEVLRTGARLAMARGCEAAMPFLTALEPEALPADLVLLASCLVDRSPERARELAVRALASPDATGPGALDSDWRAFAAALAGREMQ